MEIQILDDTDPQYKEIQPWQHHGSVYGIVPSQPGYLRPVGQWNYEEVVVDGPKIKVFLDGTLITNADLSKIEKPLDGRDHSGIEANGRLHRLHGAWVCARVPQYPLEGAEKVAGDEAII